MNDNKIAVAFFGTSQRTSEILDTLKDEFNLKFTVTKPDTRVGRDKITTQSGVKTWSVENSIPCYEVTDLKSSNAELILNKIREYKPKYIVVADFSYIVPESLINNGQSTLINIHFSLLPKYRGASPVQFAVLNGDKVTGITYQYLHKSMDKGDIIWQSEVEINPTETSGNLYERMFRIAATEIATVLRNMEFGQLKTRAQEENLATYTYSKNNSKTTQILKEDAKLNWQNSNEHIYNAVRAYNPWPIAWTTLGEILSWKGLKTYELINNNHRNKKLQIISARYNRHSDELELTEVKIEGGNNTDYRSILNGYFKKTDKN